MTPTKSRADANMRRQIAVYWGDPVSDGYGGRTFADPVELAVRWETKMELFVDVAGQTATSQAVVYVGETVAVGGYLYLGVLDDLDSDQVDDPLGLTGAYEIRAYEEIPDAVADSFLRKATL
jgi:hypothetical protein